MISIPNWGELWIIDHSTTTAEAAEHAGGASGKGGDILYRWGNPEAYQTGTVTDKQLFFQHNTLWIAPGLPGAGNILVFNNGQQRPEGDFSTIDELGAPMMESSGNYTLTPGSAYGPAELVWSYAAPIPTDFYSSFISGAQRLPNGNTLICSGATGTFFEIDSLGTVNWFYISPTSSNGPLTQGEPIPVDNNRNANVVFRATRYAPDYPGLADKDLTPGEPIEIITTPTSVADAQFEVPKEFVLHQNYPNPFNPSTTIRFNLPQSAKVTLTVYNVLGQKVAVLVENEVFTAGEHSMSFEAGNLSTGVYIYRLAANDLTSYQKMMLIR